MAARLENHPIDFEALVAATRAMIAGLEEIVLIEGIGGVMVPLDERHTVLDWIAALDIPVLLVTGSYLGTLSHTLTALAVLTQRKIPLRAIIVSETEASAVPLEATADELAHRSGVPLIALRRNTTGHSLRGLLD
jgi:dethiobiotin synthetase